MPAKEIKIKDISLPKEKAKTVIFEEISNNDLAVIIQDLIDTVKNTKASAIAAPQIGINKRIIFLFN